MARSLGRTALAALLAYAAGCTPPPTLPPQPPPPPAVPPFVPAESRAHAAVLVYPTSSVSDPAERAYAGKVTDRLAAWMKDAGLPFVSSDDDAVARGALDTCRVAILPYNRELGWRESQAFEKFFNRGGKALVFFSSDRRLAAMMGLRLGDYAATAGRLAAFRFLNDAPAGTPSRVEQNSASLRPVYPASPSAAVIAQWEDPIGRLLPEPAWVRSDRGFWMSHILLEGDAATKRQMLVALLGACDAELSRAAALKAAQSAGTLGLYPSAGHAIAALGRAPIPAGREGRVVALLAQATSLRDALARRAAAGDALETLRSAALLDAAVVQAYALLQPSRSPEFRGVWNHSGTGLQPGRWPETCQVLKAAGMTAVFPNVLRAGVAHYRSRIVPLSDTAIQYGDSLDQCVKAAHAAGIEAHAWIICWNLEDAPASMTSPFRKQGRLQVSDNGKPLAWLCPSDPANRAWQVSVVREIAGQYPVDGIHLDFIRYKSADYCYCPGCRQRFEQQTGVRVRRWPADAVSGSLSASYREWRRRQITAFVTEARRALQTVAPRAKLSAAVYPVFSSCRNSIAQDWPSWIQAGLLDFACPMNYSEDLRTISDWYRAQRSLPGGAGRIYPGIGVTTYESRLDAAQTIGQISTLRGLGAPGFMLFDLNRTLEKDVLTYLKTGPTEPSRP